MSAEQKALFDSLEGFLFSLGDDVQRKDLKLYLAFKRLRNFACVGFKKEGFFVWLKLDPKSFQFEEGFSRDVSQIGHWGTGDVELFLRSHADLDKAKAAIQKAYEGYQCSNVHIEDVLLQRENPVLLTVSQGSDRSHHAGFFGSHTAMGLGTAKAVVEVNRL